MSDVHLSNRPIRTARLPVNCQDRTGQKRGSLTVMGYFGPNRNGEGSKWVVKCECGMFTVRTGRAIRRQNMDDMCWACAGEKAMFRREFKEKHGRYPEYWELPE